MRNNFSRSCFGIDKGRTCNKGRHVPWFYLLFYHFMIKKKKKLDFLASVSQDTSAEAKAHHLTEIFRNGSLFPYFVF